MKFNLRLSLSLVVLFICCLEALEKENPFVTFWTEGFQKFKQSFQSKNSSEPGEFDEYDTHDPATVFKLFSKVYVCEQSTIYKDFLSSYAKGDILGPSPDPKPEVDSSWVKVLAKDVESNSTNATSETEGALDPPEVRAKYRNLPKRTVQNINEAVSNMNLACQSYLHFLRSFGCKKVWIPTYMQFKERYNAAAKDNSTTHPNTYEYWLRVSDTIINNLHGTNSSTNGTAAATAPAAAPPVAAPPAAATPTAAAPAAAAPTAAPPAAAAPAAAAPTAAAPTAAAPAAAAPNPPLTTAPPPPASR